MDKLLTIRDAFREQWVWLLLPVLFAICFIVPNRTGATNLYRLLIVLPVLLCFRLVDIKEIWGNTAARWFLFLCVWMTATLFWDGWSGKDIKLLLREINVLALFYLAFLVCKFHRQKIPRVINSFLWLGFVGALLILKDWQGVLRFQADLHHIESARGVFNHHLEVGWVMAVLAITALYSGQKSIKLTSGVLCFCGFLFFAAVTFLVQARGGYVVLAVGIALTLLLASGKKTWFLIIFGAVCLALIAWLFRQEFYVILDKVADRGVAGRYHIWKNGVLAISETPIKLFFGHGFSSNAENVAGTHTAAHYHNFFLNQVFYTGLLGLGLYLACFIVALKKAFLTSCLWLWGAILIAMQAGFMTDGDRLLVNPSSTMLCVLLPLFFIFFGKAYSRNQ